MKMGKHITVLLKEGVDSLAIEQGDVVVDATLGAGGHALRMLEAVGAEGKVIAFDLDKQAIDEFSKLVELEYAEFKGRLILVNENFKNIRSILKELFENEKLQSDKVDGVLADLGWRIEQIQDERYGMSFQKEMPLDMRMSPETQELTAATIVNEWSAEEMEAIFKELGEERYSRKIAELIVDIREEKPFETTLDLANLIVDANLKSGQRIHPATQVFQALRIAVNEELSNLNIFLEESFDSLKNEGRLAIISFHSLEDRLVKRFFRAKARGCVCPKEFPICICQKKRQAKIVRKKAIKESDKILEFNPRARSARMRVLQRISE